MKTAGRNDQIEKLLELLPEDNFEIESYLTTATTSSHNLVRAEEAIRKFKHRFGRAVTMKNNIVAFGPLRAVMEARIDSDQSKLQESRIIDFRALTPENPVAECRLFLNKLSRINSLPKLEFISIDYSHIDISMA